MVVVACDSATFNNVGGANSNLLRANAGGVKLCKQYPCILFSKKKMLKSSASTLILGVKSITAPEFRVSAFFGNFMPLNLP